ncbi:MAG TPA: SAM-dependent methyltransferase [Cyanothece sp. UBA12306]|nr:SAM-dependent methyltransferase [Cyanothece sp. UBA12306]
MRSQIKSSIKQLYQTLKNIGQPKFQCPICGYHGAFLDVSPITGVRKFARCPQCGLGERHRIQKLVLDQLFNTYNPSQSKILHFAPEAFFSNYFKQRFHEYISADLCMPNVDVQCDITDLPFRDGEFNFVYGSHVLEHVQDDLKALCEIKRILTPDGIAILPVPIVSEKTIEYPEPNPLETDHVRAPGKDYFERYSQFFSRVEQYSSSDFPEKYQTFLYEDRSKYPNEASPLRQPCYGQKHDDIVPVCFL